MSTAIVSPPLPAAKQMIYCPHCKKTMSEDNFYKFKSGQRDELCKACRTLHINNWEPDTFKPLLQLYDVPYIEAEWNVLRDRAYAKDPKKMTPMSVFGKYLSKMRLKNFSKYSWADTERFEAEAAERAAAEADRKAAELEEVTKAYENGELTEEQFENFKKSQEPEQHFEIGLAPGGGTQIYESGTAPFEKVELIDVGADLSEEDKVYLAMKWGTLYTAAEWVSLEQKYEEFKKSFDIQDAAREDQLLFICKTSLKMHQALDAGDVDSYQKLSKVYDAQMKAGKFTEAQKKEEANKEFDAVGSIVQYCETEAGGGYIEPLSIDTPRDIIDEVLKDMKAYTRSLIEKDPIVFKRIEEFIKKREIYEEQEQDQLLSDDDEGIVELTDEDFYNYNHNIEEQIEEDNS